MYHHELKEQHICRSEQKYILYAAGYYGNELDGLAVTKNKVNKRGEEDDEEETELIQNSSEEEMDDDGNMTSVATTPPMKPVITDRSAQKNPKHHHLLKLIQQKLCHYKIIIQI